MRWDEQQVVCPPLVHRVSPHDGKVYPAATNSRDYLHGLSWILASWQAENTTASDLEIQKLRSIAAWRARRVREIARDIQSRPEFLDLQARGGYDEPGMSVEETDRYLTEHCL